VSDIQEDLGDFRNFIFLAHKFIGLETPTPLQFEVADMMQNSSSREAIQAFRGFGKSHLAALFAMYTLYHYPEAKILVVSAAKKRASEFVKFCKELLDVCPHLVHMKAKEGARNLSYSFDVANTMPSQTPSLEAKGIESMITGSRADYIICDDLEVAVNSMSAEAREKLQGLATEFEAILLPDGAVESKILYLGTPHSSSSIYNALPDRGYTVRNYPAYNTEGEPAEPSRFPRKVLEKRRRGMGDSAFMLQYMLDTTLADHDKFPLKVNDLIISSTTLDPNYCYEEYTQSNRKLKYYVRESKATDNGVEANHSGHRVKYTRKILALDPAGSGADDFSYCVLGTRNGFLFVLEQGHWNGFNGARVGDIKAVAQKYQVNEIVVETNFGDELMVNLLQPNIDIPITPIKNYTQKEKRIISILEPVLNQHKLVVDKRFVTNKGIGQFTNLTPVKGSLKHDDYVDVLGMAVNHMKADLSINLKKARQIEEEERMEKALDSILDLHTVTHSNPSWISV
jgi:hypothetical protein